MFWTLAVGEYGIFGKDLLLTIEGNEPNVQCLQSPDLYTVTDSINCQYETVNRTESETAIS